MSIRKSSVTMATNANNQLTVTMATWVGYTVETSAEFNLNTLRYCAKLLVTFAIC